MNSNFKTQVLKDRKGERGAALVTVLMISFLLLVAVIALTLETSMNTSNVTDATSEEQAYYAAESGIQSVVDALRHGPAPDPLIDSTVTPLPPNPAAHPANRLDYRKAVERRFSNASCDPTDTVPPVSCSDALDLAPNGSRLSRWLPYDTNFPDRVILGDPAAYSPLNGFAYSVEVTDPDNTSGTVTFTTTGLMEPETAGNPWVTSRTFGTGSNTTTVEYVPPGPQPPLDVSTGSGVANVGSFIVTRQGSGGTLPPLSGLPGPPPVEPIRFKITLSVTQPQNAKVVVRGHLSPSGVTLNQMNSVGPDCTRPYTASDPTDTGVFFLFDSQNFLNFGSRQTINNGGCLVEEVKNEPGAPPGEIYGNNGPHGTYLTGWLVPAAASGVELPLTMTITQPEPTRLMIRSTGYGPRGARKQLEAIIQKNYFDGIGAPSPLTLIGPTCNTWAAATCPSPLQPVASVPTGPTVPPGPFTFDPGNSTPILYTGKDQLLKVFQPPIGLTNDANVRRVNDAISSGFNGQVHGNVENIAEELPHWLANPVNLNEAIDLLRYTAQASGTYYGPTGPAPPTGGVYGDWNTGLGISVVDRDLELRDEAGGILVVNGQLMLRGGYRFRGIIVITGRGGFWRRGGGGGVDDGILAGNMIVAPYTPDNTSLPGLQGWSLKTCMDDNTITYKWNCFLSPRYVIEGGGNSDIMGNSQLVGNGLNGLGNFVKGVAEK